LFWLKAAPTQEPTTFFSSSYGSLKFEIVKIGENVMVCLSATKAIVALFV